MIHIIVNPDSSSGRGIRYWENIRPLFEESGVPYQVHFSSREQTIESLCAALTAPGQEGEVTICALGGDGTMNAVVNGIRDFENTKVGFIQVGSGNDYARGLGIRKDPKEAVRRVLQGEVRRYCDVGEVLFFNRFEELDPLSHRHSDPQAADHEEETGSGSGKKRRIVARTRFNVSAGIGFDAAVCQEANASGFKQMLNRLYLGKLAYIGVACRQILFCPAVKMRIRMKTDAGETILRCKKALFAAFMNTPYEGGGFKFAPDADPGDGILQLCAADNIRRLSFFYIFPHAYNGSHLKFKGVLSGSGESIEIKTDRPLWVHTDGEVTCRSSHILVRTKKGALRLMC